MRSNDDEEIPQATIDEVCARLSANKSVKRSLPGRGRLNIDRLLPFLCLYRRNPQREEAGTEWFVHAEAAFLNAPGVARKRKGLATLVRRIVQTSAERLGGFLLLEIWSGPDSEVVHTTDEQTGELELPPPAFRIFTRPPHPLEKTCDTLAHGLQRIKIHRQRATSTVVLAEGDYPPKMTPLILPADAEEMNAHVIGLEIKPVYRNVETGEIYPDVLRRLRVGIGRALKKAFFTFSLNQTNVRPQHYFALGRKSLPKLVWEVDRQLAEVSGQFDFLFQVTPINAERSWQDFRESGFRAEPRFQYRPLDSDPLLLKRRLLQIPTEQIEDPTLSHLLRQTQDELDRQITMLADIGTRRFLPGSLQVFGGVEPALLDLALEILQLAPEPRENDDEQLTAHEFYELAKNEISHYRSQLSRFTAQAIVRDDIYSGLLCMGGNLLIGRELSIPVPRAQALLQHEVGTHLVTYYNGGEQPLRLLRAGLAGHDGLQEGLAVLSEYLVDGLNWARLRLLAARVVAVHEMVHGTVFSQTYSRLNKEFGLAPRSAYTVTLRVYRGGGLTKDAVYLRGLCDIVRYIRLGGELEPVLVGKIASEHIPIMNELQHRKVLKPVPIIPRYVRDPAARARLEQIRAGNGSVLELMDRPATEEGAAG